MLTVVVDGSRRSIALSVQTTGGAAPASPVLVRQSNPNQRVIFGDESPSHFARKRCEEIGCPTDVVHGTNFVLPLHPLCGGCPPDIAWPYLRRVVDEVMPRVAQPGAGGRA